MKSTILIIGSLLAVASVAQPHRHQQHHHAKRQDSQDVVWVTNWDYVTETVGVTTTIWVSSGYVPPTTSEEAATSSTSSPSEVPAQFFQTPANSPSEVSVAPAPSTSTTSSVYVAPIPSPVAPEPSSTYVAPAAAAEVETSSSSPPEPAYTPETTTSTTPVYVAPATTPEAPAPASTPASSSSSGSSSGQCSEGSPCTGDITYYTAGLGACGITSDGDTQNVVALPWELMGTQSNGNPYCGKTITITCSATGKTTTATVADKCMGCTGYSIDLSNAAFLELDDLAVGRTTAEWYFN